MPAVPKISLGPVMEHSDYKTIVEMFDGFCEVVFRTANGKLEDIDLNVLPDCGNLLYDSDGGRPCSCKGGGHRMVGMSYLDLRASLPKMFELGGTLSEDGLEPLFEALLLAKGVDPYTALVQVRETLNQLVDVGERLAERKFFAKDMV